MGHRLSKIYTRTGDTGKTGLGDGTRVDKDHLRVEAYGTVDELNSVIGIVLANDLPRAIRDCLTTVQHRLFDLGGELSVPGYEVLGTKHVTALETVLDELNSALPALKEFILPAGGHATSACHLARAVCRRAERCVVRLMRDESVNPSALAFLNRLSDLLFVMARTLARFENGQEVMWQPENKPDTQ
ncbi:MAG: cobalamin adenosyltransferase [Gammaproteobacteria bacterium SG8_47]|nr:MAG: cobalamin adenosyltransferase [Gammaproteobacteria bacterium SG8_47]